MATTKKATQRVFAVGRVISAAKEGRTNEKTGKVSTQYRLSMLTPEGVFINVRKSRYEMAEGKVEHDFVTQSFNRFDEIIEIVNEPTYKELELDEQLYVQVSTKHDAERGLAFNKLSTYKNPETGKVSITVDTFPQILEVEKDGDGDVLVNFTKKSVKFKEIETAINLQMVVRNTTEIGDDKTKWEIELCDENVDYPTSVIVQLGSVAEFGFPPVGNAFEFVCALKKGQRAKAVVGTAVYGSDTNEQQKGDDESDAITILSVPKIIEGLTSSLAGTKNGSTAPTKPATKNGTSTKALF